MGSKSKSLMHEHDHPHNREDAVRFSNLRDGNEKRFSFVFSKDSSILRCEVVAYLVEECNIETSCHVRAGIR